MPTSKPAMASDQWAASRTMIVRVGALARSDQATTASESTSPHAEQADEGFSQHAERDRPAAELWIVAGSTRQRGREAIPQPAEGPSRSHAGHERRDDGQRHDHRSPTVAVRRLEHEETHHARSDEAGWERTTPRRRGPRARWDPVEQHQRHRSGDDRDHHEHESGREPERRRARLHRPRAPQLTAIPCPRRVRTNPASHVTNIATASGPATISRNATHADDDDRGAAPLDARASRARSALPGIAAARPTGVQATSGARHAMRGRVP